MTLNEFTRKYPQSKTLRFALIPIAETQKYIEARHVLDEDEALAESYKKMKKTIDEYHKSFIDECLSNVTLSNLESFYRLYTSSADERKEEKWKISFDAVKIALRKEIAASFTDNKKYKQLNKKELIQKELEGWIEKNAPDLYFDESFKSFTTYFTGFNTNRMNMYTAEKKSTAVAFRLINENLPIFINNMRVYEIIRPHLSSELETLKGELGEYLNRRALNDLFTLENYNNVLTQGGIDEYNLIIGGKKTDKSLFKGINVYINLYNQKNPKDKLPLMTMLRKQILSDRESVSFLPEAFDDADALLDAVNGFCRELTAEKDGKSVLAELKDVLSALRDGGLDDLYVKSDAITAISVAIFGDYSVIPRAVYGEDRSDDGESRGKRKDPSYILLAEVEKAVDAYVRKLDSDVYGVRANGDKLVSRYFAAGADDRTTAFVEAYKNADALLNAPREDGCKLGQKDRELLKALLDALLKLYHFIKPLYVPSDAEYKKNDAFYGAFDPLYGHLEPVTRLYDKVRNFATKKPYSTEKIKLNFSSSTLLNGWDTSKEKANLGLLFIKDGKYYLGIMDKKHNKSFENVKGSDGSDVYKKVQYKLLPNPHMSLPKNLIPTKNPKKHGASDEIISIKENKSFTKGEHFSISDCHKLIDFYKSAISKYEGWDVFDFSFSDTDTYADISAFYREVSEQGYKITYKNIDAKYIDSLVKEGELYLFEIYNKDFSPYSKGRPSLHTMYWRALFDEKNLADVVYKLNGEAEVFYRKKSIPKNVTHPKGQPIEKKNPNAKEKGETSLFDYDIIKDRRYTVDKFLFHVPITMNFKANGRSDINDEVCTYLKNNPGVNIIGIDRGERNLLYISMIDRSGRVVKDEKGRPIQYSLNTITGKYTDRSGKEIPFETPYHKILDEREEKRKAARENWGAIESIKELKAGYMSQAVSHIARFMVKYNAIVVMEDLNSGFKNTRKKVEKQVYQNFEKALIEKLNYLVLKDCGENEPGGLYNALQLTSRFESFEKLKKQCGFIFYVPAWNTSKIDPVTGFTDLLKPKYENIAKAKAFFSKFKSISYNADGDWFEFSFDYNDFTDKARGSRTEWTVCTHGDTRYRYDRSLNNSKGGVETRNVTKHLKALFDGNDIDWKRGDIKEEILNQNGARFFAELISDLRLVFALRYSSASVGRDFILSPVADENGVFFSSEAGADGLPADADANGAFNIARKGLWVLEQIDRAEGYGDWTTKISNAEWLRYVQTRFK
ncbi:MAG: type V CRISPR-associated protein Cas12a/Cpf1 [Clostridia bacterium]|nr:type V CRISPR-associated protein Cas12a/Cpf1 [Clostridia bacterium]